MYLPGDRKSIGLMGVDPLLQYTLHMCTIMCIYVQLHYKIVVNDINHNIGTHMFCCETFS